MKKGTLILAVLALTACANQQGPKGDTGATGAQGQPGAPAPVQQMVQFCPQYTGSYGTFPEFGMVISSKVYAVYWDGHNSWLAQVYPGYYASTSTSAPCNFTVNADGSISN